MAYFPNGTSGMVFISQNCDFCSQWRERESDYPANGEGCPVWDVHIVSGYPETDEVRKLLDMLISDTATGPRCNLFTPTSEATLLERDGQLRLNTPPRP